MKFVSKCMVEAGRACIANLSNKRIAIHNHWVEGVTSGGEAILFFAPGHSTKPKPPKAMRTSHRVRENGWQHLECGETATLVPTEAAHGPQVMVFRVRELDGTAVGYLRFVASREGGEARAILELMDPKRWNSPPGCIRELPRGEDGIQVFGFYGSAPPPEA